MRPIRDRDPSKIHLLTIRTEGARLFIVPSPRINGILGGIIARYQEILGIEIFAYCFLSNHYHLLVRAPRGNLDEFAENINREIARRINYTLRRRGHFWQRRYSDQVVVQDTDALEALLYIVTNPTHHSLVKHPKIWPGLSCYSQLLTEKERTFSFTHFSRKIVSQDGKLVPYQTNHILRVSPLPQLAQLSERERIRFLKLRIEQRLLEVQKGKLFMTCEQVQKQRVGSYPRRISISPRPSCYCKSPDVRAVYLAELRLRRSQYREASVAYRLEITGPPFPRYSFKPPTHRRPRIKAFTELRAAA